ncbi:hypothetical protein HN460_02725 [bacterium]|nr:hypothetical protein [bacterium]MBT3795589.1 hypothetical protein [bacterium]
MATRISYKNINRLESLKNSKKPGLGNLLKVLHLLGEPQFKLGKTIIISGTNGKGTVANILNRIYVDSGYKVGLYTSPHLVSLNERIRIRDKKIDSRILDSYLNKVIKAGLRINCKLSFFELLTATTILYFAQKKNDLNIFEVGLGGRFDATNVIKSKIGIITNIEMDHMEYLGNSLREIAYEKIGIINNNSKLITSVKSSLMQTIKKYCLKNGTEIFKLNSDFNTFKENEYYIYESPKFNLKFKSQLDASHQVQNLGVSIKTTEIINTEYGLKITKKQLKESLRNAFNPGRFQIISKKPILIVDVSHNLHSVKSLISNFRIKYPNKRINIIIGMLKEKKPIECIKLLSRIAKRIYLTEVPNPRSFNPITVAEELKNKKISYVSNNEIASLLSNEEDYIVTGSIYLIGSLIKRRYVRIKIN